MADFWLDSNVLIRAKNEYYAFDIAPGFWRFLDEQVERGTIRASIFVYQELEDYGDVLSEWVRKRKERMFVDPDEAVQRYLRQIADYVSQTYEPNRVRKFLGGADPWIIAHAMAYGGKVVTQETRVDPRARDAKIPNVSSHFGVTSVTTWDMLRELQASFR